MTSNDIKSVQIIATTKQLIKQQLDLRGMRWVDLARMLEIKQSSLSEKLKRDKMSMDSLQKIADALGCDVYDIIQHEENIQIKCPHCGYVIKLKKEE